MKPAATMSCESCEGTGRRPISEVYQATLDAMGADWVTNVELRHRMPAGISGPAMAARLNWLTDHGFAERRLRPGDGSERDATEWRRR